jgi:hypothetical protein
MEVIVKDILRAVPLLVAFGLATHPVAQAQQFNPATYYNVGPRGSEPEQVVTADFNHDGKLDLAVANTLTGGVAILLGNGDGTFQPAKHLAVNSPIAMATADLNGDGIPDLVVQEWGYGAYLYVFLGNGDGTFRKKASYSVGDFPIAVTIADFNGDGLPDVAIACSNTEQSTPGNVAIYFGNGDGTLTFNAQYFGGLHPWGVATADLNGDGHPDLIVSDDNNTGDLNTLFILLNDGKGEFYYKSNYETGLESLQANMVDLNHDGKPDIVIASAFNQAIAVLLGKGDGTFEKAVYYSTDAFGAAPYATAIADFNMDGNLDVVATLYDGGPVIFYGNGDGTLQPGQLISMPQTGGTSIITADFNNDGVPDLALSIFGRWSVAVLTNTQ